MLAGLVIALVLGSALPVPQGADASWSEPNPDATYIMQQAPAGLSCHLKVVHDADQSVLWEIDGCFGGQSDKKFLSKDGARIIVVATLPAATGAQAAEWRKSPVAFLFEHGKLVSSAAAGQFVKDGNEVRRDVSHFSWLQGVNKVPGVPPRLNDAGDTVELDGIDGTHAVLAFSGFKVHAPFPEPHAKKHHY